MQRGKKSTGFKIGHVKSNKVNSNKKIWVPNTYGQNFMGSVHRTDPSAPGARLFVVPNNGKYAYCVVRVSLGKLRLY